MKPHIVLPAPNSNSHQNYDLNKNIVIIGSNGSGKTRFGVTIENINQNAFGKIVHRITAQRNLQLPVEVQPINSVQAESSLFSGSKQYTRWQNQDMITSSPNDYTAVLQLLFAKSNDRDRNYTNSMRSSDIKLEIPSAPIDILLTIWNDILPNRPLTLIDGKATIEIGGVNHPGGTMSDGERVIFYLISQCLIVPENGIIIIDEPEIHLHKALVQRLWNSLERYCSDKLLIYITHDLDFAASRQNAFKVWIKSYITDIIFDWSILPESDSLPEELLLQVLGSKKNVLFVEGERDSIDVAVYQAVYSNYLVISRSACHKVIESTKAIRGIPDIHHITAYAIVDSDYRTPEEVAALLSNGIHTIDVAEVENLLCTEGILRLVASQQILDPDTIVSSATNFIITTLNSEVNTQIANRTENEVKFRLNNFSKRGNNKQGILDGLTATVAAIDVNAIYAENEALYNDIISSSSLAQALKYYNRKSLGSRLSSIFNLGNGEYPALVLRMLNSERQAEVVQALMPYLPTLPD